MHYGYIYKITATDINSNLVNHYYLGQKKYIVNESLFDPNGTYYYHGSSSILKRDYWPYCSEHKKFKNWEQLKDGKIQKNEKDNQKH